AVSRGNGLVGNDITANVKTIKGLPEKLSSSVDLAVRGEIFLDKKDFEVYNTKMGNIYANPRNFAAGTIRRIKTEEVAAVPLKILCYDAYSSDLSADNARKIHDFLALNHFPMSPAIRFFQENSAPNSLFAPAPFWELSQYVEELLNKRQDFPYEIDGLVIKVSEYPLREELGYTARHPRWALAFKFESPQNESQVEDITIQIGRTGKVTPLALITPVQIAGSTVSRATLHNQDYINGLELSIGDKVLVSKRGDIIPAIEKVTEKSEHPLFQTPAACPACKTSFVTKGAHQFCPNPDCPERIREKLVYFVQTLDMENIGRSTVELLLNKGYIHNLSDFLDFDFGTLETETGFGPKKIALMRAGFEKSKKESFKTVLSALGLEEIGPKAIEILLDHGFNDVQSIQRAIQNESSDFFKTIHGIGETTALAIIRHFSDPEVLSLLDKLQLQGFQMRLEPSQNISLSTKLSDTLWVVTGSFASFQPRERALELIKQHGGRTASSVSKNTTHLLAGENAGSKLTKAQSLGIKIISEKEFLEMLG
ncbi:MAG: DNA ligase (NAD(+)) LigA, partial [Spirochaetae bacterium HGW-Spirochaetae-6]